MKKNLACVLLTAMLLPGLAACGSQSPGPNASNPDQSSGQTQTKPRVDIELLGSSGTSYQVAVGVADIISNADNGYRMSATGTTNTAANMIAMKDKDPNQAVYMGSYAAFVQCREGTVAFADYGPDDRGRMICAFSFGNNGLVTLDPNIKTIQDLDGKSVSWDAEAVHTEHFRKVCELLGINVNIKCLGFTDKYEALTDGLVDAVYGNFTGASGTVMMPVTYLQEIMLTKPIYPIPFPADLQSQAAGMLDATWPYTATSAAEGTIEGQPSFELYGSASVTLCCYADADEDMIYTFTKSLCENVDKLGNFDSSCIGLTPEMMVSQLGDIDEALIHPGALRYYREAGLWPVA